MRKPNLNFSERTLGKIFKSELARASQPEIDMILEDDSGDMRAVELKVIRKYGQCIRPSYFHKFPACFWWVDKRNLGLYTGYLGMKISLKVTVRKGVRIESVLLKQLERLAEFRKKRWKLKDGWLILEAF